MEEMLNHLADQVLDMDPCDLADMLPDVQARMDNRENEQDWERAVITFFLINAIRFKTNMAERCQQEIDQYAKDNKPKLRLVQS